MPRTQKPISKLGKVEYDGECYLVHVQYRDTEGIKKHIRGPRRQAVHRARKDLSMIRAAGGIGLDREDSLYIMAAEAMRLRHAARFAAGGRRPGRYKDQGIICQV